MASNGEQKIEVNNVKQKVKDQIQAMIQDLQKKCKSIHYRLYVIERCGVDGMESPDEEGYADLLTIADDLNCVAKSRLLRTE